LLPDQGRICIDAYVGKDQTLDRGRAQQQVWQAQRVAGYLTSHNLTLDSSGALMPMAQKGLFARCLALLGDKTVQALLLAIQTDELLHSGLPAWWRSDAEIRQQ
jgi:cyanophycin synthetase